MFHRWFRVIQKHIFILFILFHLATTKRYSNRAFRSVLLLVFLRNIFVLAINLKFCIILCVSLREIEDISVVDNILTMTF